MNIPPFTTAIETELLKEELMENIERIIDSGQFIMGPEVENLEKEVAEYLNIKYAVGVNSGTDALVIGLRAAGVKPGEEVLCPSFTFFATAEAVEQVGAKPIFVDVDINTYNIETNLLDKYVTNNTTAIIPVHLYGQAVEMTSLINWAEKNNITVVEDVAQAFGAEHGGVKAGTIGDVGCYSFFPTKNLGAYGDGGLIVTNDEKIYMEARRLRVHGSEQKYHNEIVGYNSRLDAIQAAILRVKLKRIDEWNEKRQVIASKYKTQLAEVKGLVLPKELENNTHVYHQFTIRVLNGKRETLQQYLKDQGISTMIYYPIPVHQLPLYNMTLDLPNTLQLKNEVLSLPIYPHMDETSIERVTKAIKVFMGN